PLKNSQRPIELEISLTPPAALYYELEGSPVCVMTPTATESNRVVWANLRATGKQKIVAEGKEKELSPALIFQARAMVGKVETFAYGPRCKVTESAIEAARKLAEAQPSR